jgi:hypothetical protein
LLEKELEVKGEEAKSMVLQLPEIPSKKLTG